jgi:hypothetical protein
MYIATGYETDNGDILAFSVSLYIGYNKEQKQIADNPLIPSILLPAMTWFLRNPCPTKQVTARYVNVFLVSGDVLQIAYPFRPGSANWLAFWQQLQSPDIISVQGFGEKVTDKYLRKSLGIV